MRERRAGGLGILGNRALAVFVGALAMLVLVEGGLRVYGALSRWQHGWTSSVGAGEGPTILCIGESTTFWGGNDSYPAQLERLLNAASPEHPVRVISAADPGRDTRTIVANLPGRLETHRPTIVVAMMGANDTALGSAVPPRAALGLGEGPLGSLRILRLARMVWFRVAQQRTSVQVDRTIELDREASALAAAGDEVAARATYQRVLEAALEDDEVYFPIATDLNGDASKAAWVIAALEPILAARPDDRRGWQLLGIAHLARNELDPAAAAFRRALGCQALGGWAFHTAQSPLPALAGVLVRQGKPEEALALYRDACTRLPDDGALAARFARFAADLGDEEEAGIQRERASRLQATTVNPWTRGAYDLTRAELRRRGIALVAVQYPGRPLAGLRALLEPVDEVVLVDTEQVFHEAVLTHGYDAVFVDACYGDLGHGSALGNRLLAESVARALYDGGLIPRPGPVSP